MTDVDILDSYDEEGPGDEFRDDSQYIGPSKLYVAPSAVFVRDIGSDQFTFATIEIPVNFGPGFNQYPRPVQLSPRFESGVAHRVSLIPYDTFDTSTSNIFLFRREDDFNVAIGAGPYCPHGFPLINRALYQFVTSAPLYAAAIASNVVANPILCSIAIETFYGRT